MDYELLNITWNGIVKDRFSLLFEEYFERSMAYREAILGQPHRENMEFNVSLSREEYYYFRIGHPSYIHSIKRRIWDYAFRSHMRITEISAHPNPPNIMDVKIRVRGYCDEFSHPDNINTHNLGFINEHIRHII